MRGKHPIEDEPRLLSRSMCDHFASGEVTTYARIEREINN